MSLQAPTWSEKKCLLSSLQDAREKYESLMASVLRGATLTDQEQSYLDSVDGLDEKVAAVKAGMQAHVKEGRLTSGEKATLVGQVTAKIDAGEKGLAKRLEALEACKGDFAVPFRNRVLLLKVCVDLAKIENIEKRAGGRLMTQKELKIVGEREEVRDRARGRSSRIC